jgi:hypothetical protein
MKQWCHISNSSTSIRAQVAKALLNAGMLVVPAGPRVVRFVPPLIITEAEIESAMVKFEKACVSLSPVEVVPAPGSLTKTPEPANWFQKLMALGGK